MTEVELIELAAGVFGIRNTEVQLDTSPADLPQWDSLNHLNLITAFESKSSIQLSMKQIQSIEVLGDFLAFHDSNN